jgi:cell division protein FtsQ
MPDILNVEIEEYHPFAIWINDDKKFIIDKEGNSIPFLEEYEQSEEFKNMIILSGVGANQNAKSLFNILVINSEISQDIYSANWVGNRRWDIRFFDGLLVKLPEIEISNAWHDLIKIYLASKNDKAIKSIDLRVSGKIYLQYYNKKSFEINLRKI